MKLGSSIWKIGNIYIYISCYSILFLQRHLRNRRTELKGNIIKSCVFSEGRFYFHQNQLRRKGIGMQRLPHVVWKTIYMVLKRKQKKRTNKQVYSCSFKVEGQDAGKIGFFQGPREMLGPVSCLPVPSLFFLLHICAQISHLLETLARLD